MKSELETLLELRSDTLLDQLESPNFHQRERVHDWRNYVPEALHEYWSKLSIETRLVVYAMAERQAEAEEWD